MNSLSLPFARQWLRFERENVAHGLATAALIAALGVGTAMIVGGANDAAAAEAPPPPLPMAYRPLAPEEAIRLNAALPVNAPIESVAKPFALPGGNAVTQSNALECLTSAIYYEAGQESTDGQRAVAQVVLNRVRHPAFPASVCGVVFEGSTRQTGCQFTFTCDGSLLRAPPPDTWSRARKVAREALNGAVFAGVGNATHYHANYVMPYWAPTLAKTAVIGAHIFYRWNGNWGQPGAFNQAYAGREANPALLRTATLAVNRTVVAPTVLAAMPIAKVDGVAVREAGDGKRVRILFTQQARAEVEKVVEKRTPYIEKVSASDNLRYALGDDAEPSGEQLGRAKATDATIKAN